MSRNRRRALRFTTLLLAFVAGSRVAYTCSCGSNPPPFLEAARDAPIVAIVKGERLHGSWGKGKARFADVNVLRYLKGALPITTLVVEGDNGAECREYASVFKPGRTWVVALHIAQSFKPERPTYSVSRCSTSMLPLADGQVMGAIERASTESEAPLETIPLKSLVERLRTQAEASSGK